MRNSGGDRSPTRPGQSKTSADAGANCGDDDRTPRSSPSQRGAAHGGLSRTALLGQAVADAPLVEDVGWVGRVVAEFLAELIHEGAHRLGVPSRRIGSRPALRRPRPPFPRPLG